MLCGLCQRWEKTANECHHVFHLCWFPLRNALNSTDDRNIYCVECMNKNREIMEKSKRAITVDETDEKELFRDEGNKEIK